MAQHDILQDARRSNHAHGARRKHDARAPAATQFTSTGGTETFTGVNSVPSNSLILGSGLPTTQSHSSGLLTQSGPGDSVTQSTPTSTSSTTSDTSSVTPGVNTPAPAPTSSSFVSNHKLLLAGVIAGFVALVLVVAIVIWLFIRRARRKREEETVARQSFAAGAALAGGSRGKETFPMSEASLFKGPPLHSASAHTKKGSRSDDWNGLSSRDDHYPPDDVANDAASVRTGGHRSPYNQPSQPYQLTLSSLAQSPPVDNSHLAAVPPYTLTGAFATALSAEDEEERDVSVANHSSSHAGSPKIERGPVMHRVPQTQPHPHPYADPSVFASAVSAQGTPSYHAGGPRQQHQQAVFDALEDGADEDNGNGAGLRPQPSPSDFLSFSPSTASAGPTGESALGKSATQDYFNLPMPEPSSPMIPPSPSSMYSQQPQPAPAPGPVLSPSFRSGAQSTTPSNYTTNSSSGQNGGLAARPSTKQSKAERAVNMRALGDLIAALDSAPSATNSMLAPSDALDGRGGRPMPEAGMWRAALGSSPTLGTRQNSDSSAGLKKR